MEQIMPKHDTLTPTANGHDSNVVPAGSFYCSTCERILPVHSAYLYPSSIKRLRAPESTGRAQCKACKKQADRARHARQRAAAQVISVAGAHDVDEEIDTDMLLLTLARLMATSESVAEILHILTVEHFQG